MDETRGLLSRITTNQTTPGGELTPEALERTFEQLMRPRPPHHHIISPRAEPGSWTLCSDCRAVVRVPDDWGRSR
jgi:hypothetical protein